MSYAYYFARLCVSNWNKYYDILEIAHNLLDLFHIAPHCGGRTDIRDWSASFRLQSMWGSLPYTDIVGKRRPCDGALRRLLIEFLCKELARNGNYINEKTGFEASQSLVCKSAVGL